MSAAERGPRLVRARLSPARCGAAACGYRADAAGARARGTSPPPRRRSSPWTYRSCSPPLSSFPTASPEPSALTGRVPAPCRSAAVDAACSAASGSQAGTPGKTLAGMD